MAMPLSSAPNPLVVFGPQYVLPYETTLLMKEKVSLSGDDFDICDVTGNVFFRLKTKLLSLHHKRVIYDSHGRPVLCIKKKSLSLRNTAYIYSGEEFNDSNLVCKVRKTIVSFLPQAQVYLISSKSKTPDLTIKGSFHERKFYIQNHVGVIVAEVSRNPFSLRSLLVGKDIYYVRILPGVDMALIIGLVNVIEEVFVEPQSRNQGLLIQ